MPPLRIKKILLKRLMPIPAGQNHTRHTVKGMHLVIHQTAAVLAGVIAQIRLREDAGRDIAIGPFPTHIIKIRVQTAF